MALNLSDKTASRVRVAGGALLLLGGALAVWAFQRFGSLPNYQRLALLVPLLTSIPMVFVDAYRSRLSGYWAGQAIGAAIAPPLVAIGAIIWFLADASAKA